MLSSQNKANIFLSDGLLFIRRSASYDFMGELIPQSDRLFHVRGGIDLWIEFNDDYSGYSLIDGDEVVTAIRD